VSHIYLVQEKYIGKTNPFQASAPNAGFVMLTKGASGE
jgi:hypothetical protein